MRHLRFALLITGSICVALSQNALGDGFPEAQYSPRSVYNWTGFYAGAHLGGTWGTTEAFDNLGYNAVGDSWDADTSGFVAGVQLGYNWQAGPILFGIEGDVGNLGLTGSAPQIFRSWGLIPRRKRNPNSISPRAAGLDSSSMIG